MIDIKLIRENPRLIKENQKKRRQDIKIVDKVIKLDEEWRRLKYQVDSLRSQRNKISLEINQLKKQKKDASLLIKKAKSIPGEINQIEEKAKILEQEINISMSQIHNITHNTVPTGKDATKNKVLKIIGKPKKFSFKPKSHVELGESLNILDFDKSAKTSGKGFYILKGKLALLNQALIRFAIDFMKKKGYTYIETPLLLKKNILMGALDNAEFQKSIYETKEEDLALIGTAEHSLLGMHAHDCFKLKELPKKYFSYSMCFRREIGSHGIDEKGLFRTHQFNKVEQFIFCLPKDSPKYYDELLKNSIGIFKLLKIPIRALEMCSGDLAAWKAKSADLEFFSPRQKQYVEIGSLTNCTDFQARNLNIKYIDSNNQRQFVHTLNNTALATSRALVAIMENFQTKQGTIKIPKVLWKYTGFKEIGQEK